jgi:hypothetical protein
MEALHRILSGILDAPTAEARRRVREPVVSDGFDPVH